MSADFATALVLLAVASVSFVGLGMITAVLPLISPEKGAQLGFIAQGLLLVVSGVYYPVSVLPQWMQAISDDIARDLCAARDPSRCPQRRGTRRCLGRCVAAAGAWRGVDPARTGRVPSRRALRQAPRQAQALGVVRRPGLTHAGEHGPANPASLTSHGLARIPRTNRHSPSGQRRTAVRSALARGSQHSARSVRRVTSPCSRYRAPGNPRPRRRPQPQ